MSMHGDGLAKLAEEAGEVVQIAMKKLAFMHTDEHPDGKGSLKERLEDEIADFLAAADLVTVTLGLDRSRISARVLEKRAKFRAWHEPSTVAAETLEPALAWLELMDTPGVERVRDRVRAAVGVLRGS